MVAAIDGHETELGLDWIRSIANFVVFRLVPVSSEISGLYEMSDLLLFVSHFAFQSR